MKTTVKELDYEKVMALPQYPHLHPIRPGIFWRTLVRGCPSWDWPEPISITPAREWRRSVKTSRA